MKVLPQLLLSATLGVTLLHSAFAGSSVDLIKQGEAVALAGDCMACHSNEGGKAYAGGKVIASPMGNIISTNITPSKQFGIGNYSEKAFADAVRKGKRADGSHLYPAMPYPEYAGISDQDIKALYAYMMNAVEAVDQPLSEETSLSFPFNIRTSMMVWNWLFANTKPTLTGEVSRGQYLVDSLEHCSTCHTPRNALMALKSDQYLAGGSLGSWYAPNITPDESGIGHWSSNDLRQYLKTGHNQFTTAAGPMAEAITYSLHKLSDEDIDAMVEHLQQIPAIKSDVSTKGKLSASDKQAHYVVDEVVAGILPENNKHQHDTLEGQTLYTSACASCHATNGKGSSDGFYPSLHSSTAVRLNDPSNLVMSISEGIYRQGANGEVQMPAFEHEMSPAQIAAVSNYVIKTFADRDSALSAKDVTLIQQGGEKPLLLKAMPFLIALFTLIAIVIIILAVRRYQQRRA